MKAYCLKFYTYEFQKQYGILLHEWLMEFAKKNEIPRGFVDRGITGYGNNHSLQENLFESSSDIPVSVSFILSKDKMDKFLSTLKEEKINLFYTFSEVDYGVIEEI